MRITDERSATTPLLVYLVHERGNRWFNASKRFVPTMLPANVRVMLRSVTTEDLIVAASTGLPTIVVWEADRAGLGEWVGRFTRLASTLSPVFPVVATSDLTSSERLALLELGVRAFVARPEELPRLAVAIRAALTRSGGAD